MARPTRPKRTERPQTPATGPSHSGHIRAEWSGPLPPPGTLAEFDSIVPGAAERIVNQFEREAEHRRELERKQTRFVIRDTHIGQAIAGAFALASLGVAAFAIAQGAQWAGAVIGGGVVVPIVYAFLRQTLKDR